MKIRSCSVQEFRWRTIIKLHELGKGQKEIAQIVDCDQSWVSKVLKRYKSYGLESFLTKGKTRGAPTKLNDQALECLSLMLVQGALVYGFETDNWTRERIATLIRDKFSVSYHPAHISRLMRKIGFSLQKPKTRSYRKDDLQVSKWKKEQLPRLKKSP
ncbi:MAG: winged helix-turn-helix domain-containing protein [Bacteroidota bacterium]